MRSPSARASRSLGAQLLSRAAIKPRDGDQACRVIAHAPADASELHARFLGHAGSDEPLGQEKLGGELIDLRRRISGGRLGGIGVQPDCAERGHGLFHEVEPGGRIGAHAHKLLERFGLFLTREKQ